MSRTPSSPTYTYDLLLPVFKQGDDLAHHMAQHQDDPVQAFRALAEQYSEAASICRRVAGVLMEIPSDHKVRVWADTHVISLTTEYPDDLQGLLADKILQEDDFDGEDDGEIDDEFEDDLEDEQ